MKLRNTIIEQVINNIEAVLKAIAEKIEDIEDLQDLRQAREESKNEPDISWAEVKKMFEID